MTDKEKQEPVADETSKPSAPQKHYRQIPFASQLEAYKWLMLECPKEYHFAVGTREDTGEMIVLVSVAEPVPPTSPVEAEA